jgi:hypothetical protein
MRYRSAVGIVALVALVVVWHITHQWAIEYSPGFTPVLGCGALVFFIGFAVVFRSRTIAGALIGYLVSVPLSPLHGPDIKGTVFWVIVGALVGLAWEAQIKLRKSTPQK